MSLSPAADLPRAGGVALGRVMPLRYYFESEPIAFTEGQTAVIKHGLGRKPAIITWSLLCVVNDQGWIPGDELTFAFFEGATGQSRGVAINATETDLEVQFGATNGVFMVSQKITGQRAAGVDESWRFIVRAQA